MIWSPRLLDKSISISVYTGDASNWERCAVGEFLRSLGMDSDGPPQDRRLLVWGEKFANAVGSNDRKTAIRLYRRMSNYIARGGGCDH